MLVAHFCLWKFGENIHNSCKQVRPIAFDAEFQEEFSGGFCFPIYRADNFLQSMGRSYCYVLRFCSLLKRHSTSRISLKSSIKLFEMCNMGLLLVIWAFLGCLVHDLLCKQHLLNCLLVNCLQIVCCRTVC